MGSRGRSLGEEEREAATRHDENDDELGRPRGSGKQRATRACSPRRSPALRTVAATNDVLGGGRAEVLARSGSLMPRASSCASKFGVHAPKSGVYSPMLARLHKVPHAGARRGERPARPQRPCALTPVTAPFTTQIDVRRGSHKPCGHGDLRWCSCFTLYLTL